jgi:hypothetical protein
MKDFKLDNQPQIATGFTTPDNYFSDFSAKVLQQLPKVDNEPLNETRVIPFWAKNRSWIYAAAAILVVAFSILMMNLMDANSEEIHTTEIEHYLTYNADITDDEIVELLEEEDLKNITIETSVEPETIEEILYNESNLEEQIIN